jgi:uroporphyrinogen decarboxylase
MSQAPSFQGLRVAAFESRQSAEMARLIEKFGGEAFVSPSMREAPLGENEAAIDFAHRLITGQINIVIFLTGVGFRHLLAQVERRVDRQRYLHALNDITTIVRGPKPAAAMKEVGLTPTWRADAPNTWREVLTTIDRHVSVAGQVVALQEYGQSNASLVAGLEARGAEVLNLKVYSWELPQDTAPLEDNVRAVADGRRDVLLFTSAHQVANLLRIADKIGQHNPLTARLGELVIGSIGPTTSEMLRDHDWPVDIEPEVSRMGQLVAAAAAQAPDLRRQKSERWKAPARPKNADAPHDRRQMNGQAAWDSGPFMKACRGEPAEVTPIWLMRQAGRYMAEYRRVRAKTTFLDLCKNPALCSEVMCTAVSRLGVDAAIIFSDLLPILEPMGFDLEFAQGEGPVIHNPLREPADVDRVVELEDLAPLDFVIETVRQTRADLPEPIPLIGFAGAPFTLASYAIEGGASRNYQSTKALMYRDEGAWDALMQRLARAVTRYLNGQIAAGAQCVQLFDSWVGCLGPADYRRYVLPYVKQIASGISPGIPLINFATGNPALLPAMAEAEARVVGVDWRIPLDRAWDAIGRETAIQGNLDPAVLLADPPYIREQAKRVLAEAAGRPGHIFNLGHGVFQQTPVENAAYLVEAVHELSLRR